MLDRVRTDLLPPLQAMRRRLIPLDGLYALVIGVGLSGVWRVDLTDPLLLQLGSTLHQLTLLVIAWSCLPLAWRAAPAEVRWTQARMIVRRYATVHLVRLLMGLTGPAVLDAIQQYPTEALSLGIALLLMRLVIWPTSLPSR